MINDKRQCQWPGRSNPAGPVHMVFGRTYCTQHYFDGVESAFIDEIGNLEEGQQPKQNNKFRNLFKRYIEGLLELWTPPGLAKMTPSMIEGRAEVSYICKERIEFSMERHGSFVPVTYYFQLIIKDRKINQIFQKHHYVYVSEFAESFGLTEKKVRALIRTGKLEAVRARELQDEWYYLMLESGRENVYNPRQVGTMGSTPGNAYLIPFGEIERFSKLDKPYGKKEES